MSGPGPAAVEVQVLGPVRVLRHGAPIPLGSGKQRLVLGLLVAARGRGVSADALLLALWGESPSAGAQATLQSHVSRLRTALGGPQTIAYDAAGYRLVDVGTDVDAFEAACSPSASYDDVRNALARWRGAPYEDLEATGLIDADREHLAELRWLLVERKVDADLAAGRPAEVVPELEAAIREQPLREGLYARLMLALYRCGRQADALDAYRRLLVLLRDELGVDPSPQLQDLHVAVLAQSASLLAPRQQALPKIRTSFVGREQEVHLVRELLRSGPLVTLVGAGGSGKTRLAYEVASSYSPVVLVDLALVGGPALVAGAIADAVGITQPTHDPAELAAHVAAQLPADALLLLDNAESMLAAAAEVVTALLAAAVPVRILVTSRSALQVPGERQFLLPGLETPPSTGIGLDALAELASVRLFCDRAAAVSSDFALDTGSALAVAGICRALDGLPLAIELAAGSLTRIGLDELARRVRETIDVLSGGAAHPERHRTLRAALGWSYDLLPATERVVLQRLAVIPGRFTSDLAERVCADDVLPRSAVLPALMALTGASLLVLEPGGTYRLLETVRAFARELGAPDGAAEERHVAAIRELAAALPRSPADPAYDAAVAALDAAAESVGVAFGHCITRGRFDEAVDLLGDIWWWWYVRARFGEASGWCDALLPHLDGVSTRARVRACNGAAFLAYAQGDFDAAEHWSCQALAGADGLGDDEATAHMVRGLVARYRGDLETARTHIARTLELHETKGDLGGIAHALGDLGDLSMRENELAAAEQLFERSLLVARQADDRWATARALLLLAEIGTRTERWGVVPGYAGEAVAHADELGDRRMLTWALRLWGLAETRTGAEDSGRDHLAKALTICVDVGDRLGVAQRLEDLAAVLPDDVALEALGSSDALRAELGLPADDAAVARRRERIEAATARLGAAAVAAGLEGGRRRPVTAVVHDALRAASVGAVP